MDKKKFVAAAIALGWKLDRWGHLRLTFMRKHPETGETTEVERRIASQALSFRFETRVRTPASEYSPASSRWVRLFGDYYKAAKLLDDGSIMVSPKVLRRLTMDNRFVA